MGNWKNAATNGNMGNNNLEVIAHGSIPSTIVVLLNKT
jgi:hypothetical protein